MVDAKLKRMSFQLWKTYHYWYHFGTLCKSLDREAHILESLEALQIRKTNNHKSRQTKFIH